MKRLPISIIVFLAVLLLTACGGTPAPDVETTTSAASETTQATQPIDTPVPSTATPMPGFKDRSLCPDSNMGVSVPERLPNMQWSVVDSPSDADIRGIQVLSATDAWAVGRQVLAGVRRGSILHYDGAAWTTMDSPSTSGLLGLSLLAADEGWVVEESGIILHYANQRWSTVDAPSTYLRDVDFVAPDNGWAVGTDKILHYDGNNWIAFSRGELGISEEDLQAVDIVSADEGWAVGDRGMILHLQGGTWQQVDSSVEKSLRDVVMNSAEEGWIVGYGGTILHFDGTTWSITDSPTQASLYAVATDDEGKAWAVGAGGALLRFDGQTWAKIEIPVKGDLWDVSISDDGAAWAVGDDGLILRGELLDTDAPPPSPPLLKTIDNNDGDGSFSVSWESVPGNVNYVLEETDESMCPVTIYFGPETLEEVSRKDIGTYYYRVSALGVSGQSEWSEVQSVKVTVPPPPCSVECTSSSGGLFVEITCESGEYSSPGVFSYKGTGYYPRWDKELWGTHFTEERTYEDSGNMYEVHAFIWPMSDVAGGRGYYVEITGGVFGETPEICDVETD